MRLGVLAVVESIAADATMAAVTSFGLMQLGGIRVNTSLIFKI